MKKRIAGLAVAVALFLGGGLFALACSVAGPSKHVGQVTSVNAKAGTFTILDAETHAPIEFSASREILRDAGKSKGPVMISYRKSGNHLVAEDIHF